MKCSFLGMEWGVVPVLEVDGVQLHQSVVIARFLGRNHGLTASNNFDQARIEAVVETFIDAEQSLSKCLSDR